MVSRSMRQSASCFGASPPEPDAAANRNFAAVRDRVWADVRERALRPLVWEQAGPPIDRLKEPDPV